MITKMRQENSHLSKRSRSRVAIVGQTWKSMAHSSTPGIQMSRYCSLVFFAQAITSGNMPDQLYIESDSRRGYDLEEEFEKSTFLSSDKVVHWSRAIIGNLSTPESDTHFIDGNPRQFVKASRKWPGKRGHSILLLPMTLRSIFLNLETMVTMKGIGPKLGSSLTGQDQSSMAKLST